MKNLFFSSNLLFYHGKQVIAFLNDTETCLDLCFNYFYAIVGLCTQLFNNIKKFLEVLSESVELMSDLFVHSLDCFIILTHNCILCHLLFLRIRFL